VALAPLAPAHHRLLSEATVDYNRPCGILHPSPHENTSGFPEMLNALPYVFRHYSIKTT
jgi:hypothetical protein